MNDLDLIRAARPDVPLADPGELAPARSQLAAAIATELRAESAPGTTPPRSRGSSAAAGPGRQHGGAPFWPARRRALAVIAATAVAAGVTATLVALPGPGGQSGAGSAAPVLPATTPVIGHLTAARFLHAAARAALRQPAGAPAPGQFIFTETANRQGILTEAWLSASGDKAGVILQFREARVARSGYVGEIWSCRRSQSDDAVCWQGIVAPLPALGQKTMTIVAPCTSAQDQDSICWQRGYFASLPTRPDLMIPYLKRIDRFPPVPPAKQTPNLLGPVVNALLNSIYLRSSQRAALLDLMAQTPGFTVVSHVRDALGRVGVGIEWTYRGRTNAVIFDRRSYAYLGAVLAPPNVPNQGTLPGRPLPAGAALVKSGVVSKLPPVAATALRMGLKAVSKAGGSPGAAGKS